MLDALSVPIAGNLAGLELLQKRDAVILVDMPLQEKALIARIRRTTRQGSRSIIAGIGDDAAVLRLPPGHEVLVTTDFSLEGVHFRPEWHPPDVVGWRCLTRGLSDIAAMGGEPQAAFLSLALPKKLAQRWVDRFIDGMMRLASQFEISLAGGDTAQSPDGILADIVVVGSVPRGKAVMRSGAKPGDRIYVTGELGGGSAALDEFYAGRKAMPRDFARHFYPLPRIAIGRFLRAKGLASAMIDLSDGLSTDLAHICEESGRGAEILRDAIPLASVGRQGTQVKLRHGLHGGDDYELLFTVPRGKPVPSRIAGVPVTLIGHMRGRASIVLRNDKGVGVASKPRGWEHLKP